jgi:hypothetical protein
MVRRSSAPDRVKGKRRWSLDHVLGRNQVLLCVGVSPLRSTALARLGVHLGGTPFQRAPGDRDPDLCRRFL